MQKLLRPLEGKKKTVEKRRRRNITIDVEAHFNNNQQLPLGREDKQCTPQEPLSNMDILAGMMKLEKSETTNKADKYEYNSSQCVPFTVSISSQQVARPAVFVGRSRQGALNHVMREAGCVVSDSSASHLADWAVR